jgi:hypothetical protein
VLPIQFVTGRQSQAEALPGGALALAASELFWRHGHCYRDKLPVCGRLSPLQIDSAAAEWPSTAVAQDAILSTPSAAPSFGTPIACVAVAQLIELHHPLNYGV